MEQNKHLMQTYGRLPVSFVRGEGAWLWDDRGNQYLDAMTGIAVCSLGHSHPAVTEAVCQQAGTLLHTSNWFNIPAQTGLADDLCRLSGMDRVFFSNSGAEANEAAIKLARLWGHNRGVEQPTIIVTEHSFHGRTLATLTATGSRKVQAGFEPLVQGFARVPFNDIEAISQVGENNPGVVAIMVEPVQGEGGINIPDAGYLKQLRELCDSNDWLLILDEIQTGMGRTGKWFACQHESVQPDIMTLAKALGNGVPIGACLAAGKAADVLQPGNHGSTFGGNPLACTAAHAVVQTIESEHLVDKASVLGQRILTGLTRALDGIEGVTAIRGIGMMLAIELDRPCPALMQAGLDQGIVLNVTSGNVVRLLPPFILTEDEADQVIELTAQVVSGFLSS